MPNDFRVEVHSLPHEGVSPGARGLKKVVYPKGTKVHCIIYGRAFYWAAYLNEAQAKECMANLQASVDGTARRNIPLATMVAWNFHPTAPKRIIREKVTA